MLGFHFDKLGKCDKELHSSNIFLIHLIFHLDKSGKNNNEWQLLKISPINIILVRFHFDISGIVDNEIHP